MRPLPARSAAELSPDNSRTDRRRTAGKPEKTARIRVSYNETELRLRVKDAGGTWHPERKLWLVPLKKIKALKLES